MKKEMSEAILVKKAMWETFFTTGYA